MNEIRHYDSIIIGFGKGGKTLAAALGAAGQNTVVIERSPQMYGGTCINVGCIPTKFLVQKAHEAKSVQSFEAKAALYAETIEKKDVLTGELRGKNLQKLVNTPNVTVLTGTAKLCSAHEVEVYTDAGVQRLAGDKIFLNTGSVPVIPSIEGVEGNPYVVTSEGLLADKTLPKRLVIIGGGYIGIEFASIYANFGSEVTVLQPGNRFLPREDAEIADAVMENLQSRGVTVLTGADIRSVTAEDGEGRVTVLRGEEPLVLEADRILVATGRRPNTDGLGLENTGVELTSRGGLVTDAYLCTTEPDIYAMGDVVGGLQFTYVSLDDFRIVRSAVLGDKSYSVNDRGVVPYSVFLDPPFSRVGLSEQEALERGFHVKIARLPAAAIPKAQVLEQPSGILKAVIDADTGMILGAHLFCEESHEIINLIKLAMDAGLPYTRLRDMIFTHPTMGEALNDLFNV